MLHRYAVFDLFTGGIVRLVDLKFAPSADSEQRRLKAECQAREGQGVVELPDDFDGDDTTHRVADGALVPLIPDPGENQ